MDSVSSGYNNQPSPLKGMISEWIDRRRNYRDMSEAMNREHENHMTQQAMAHQYATERIYHQGNADMALADQQHAHASSLSAQESRQRRGELRNAAKTLSEAGGGRPVSSMTVPGGSVTFGDEKKKKKRKSRSSSPQPPSAPAASRPPAMSPQFSAAHTANTAQGPEPRVSRSGM